MRVARCRNRIDLRGHARDPENHMWPVPIHQYMAPVFYVAGMPSTAEQGQCHRCDNRHRLLKELLLVSQEPLFNESCASMPQQLETDSGTVDPDDDMYCVEHCPSALPGFHVKLSLT